MSSLPNLLDGVVKIVPSYADLFGEISLCECEDCQSILSPAAYFVDLLQFLSRCPKNALGRTPLEVLLERRPDLEFTLLTCENSNTELPAIDLVNEILEVVVALGKVDASAAHDTGSITAEELAANPQFAVAKARDMLRDGLYPIRLPFHLALEIARAYFKALGTTRAEVMGTLRQDALLPDPLLSTEEAIAAEALGWSQLDFELITGMQFGGASATSGSLEDLYGLTATDLTPLLAAGAHGNAVRLLQQKLNSSGASAPLVVNGDFDATTEAALKTYQAGIALPPTGTTTLPTWTFLDNEKPQTAPGLVSWVTEFLLRAMRSYTDLVAICQTRTFNPLGAAVAALGATKVTWKDVADLNATGFTLPNAAIVAGASDLGLLLPDFVAWLKQRFDGLASSIVIEIGADSCDLADAHLRRIDGGVVSSDTLIAINRFLRLCDKTGLSISEADCALSALHGIGVLGTTDANFPLSLSAMLRLRKRTKLSLPELAVLLGYFETGPGTLYSQLFLNRAALALDGSFGLNSDGSELALATEAISSHIPALIAAFRISAEELDVIRVHSGLDAPTATMSLQRLAQLYRYPLLARALEISVADLLTMTALSAPDPWLATTDQPIRLERMIVALDTLAGAKLEAPDVGYLLRHVIRSDLEDLKLDQLGTQAATLHDEQIDLTVEIGSEPGMSIERFQTLLARLVGPDAVDQLLGIVTGSATFTAPYSKTPPAASAAAFAPNVIFEPSQKVVRFARRAMPSGSVVTLGALTDGEKAALQSQAAADGDADLVDAVGILHARPRAVLADTLAGLTTGTTIAAEILKDGAGARDVEGKLRFLVESLLPYIHEALALAVIKQQLLPFAGLEAPMLALLVEDASIITPPGSAESLSAPLRALERQGWFGEFFTTTTSTGIPFASGQIDSLSYDGVGGDFGQASPVGSARWSAIWLPHVAGSVVLEVVTNGTLVLLWNGVAVSATIVGQRWRFEAKAVAASDRVKLVLEWRRTGSDPATLYLAWINGNDARTPLPARRLIPAPVFLNAIGALGRLDKAARLLRAVAIEPVLLRHVNAHPSEFFAFSLNSFPLTRAGSEVAIDTAAPSLFRGLLRTIELTNLAPPLRGDQPLAAILGSASVADAITAIGAATGWKEADIGLLAGSGGFNISLNEVIDGRALLLIRRAITLTQRVGVGTEELIAWAIKPVDDALADDIKRSVRAKFNDADWLTLTSGLNDPIRERWRDALVSYLLPRLGFSSPNQLFELLLLDTEVSSCVKTSRIRQTTFAVQTFAQRVHLNLENFDIPGKPPHPGTVKPSAIDAEIWESKKYYRVQEAARKVFCYPESYMRETLRDNKTPLFDRLIGDLGQTSLTKQGVESAFLNFLKGLNEVERLEVCGTYAQGYDAESRELIDVVHIIGRTTLGAPYSYYYRRLEADRHWTPWERLPIDIDAVHTGKLEGVHVLPVIWNRRLYVFWPILEEKPDGKVPGGNAMNESQAHRDWRKKHDQWQETHDKWVAANEDYKKKYDQYQKDKADWDKWRGPFGNHLPPYPVEPPAKSSLSDQPEPLEPPNYDSIEPDNTHIDVRLAWAEFFDGNWSPKQVSSLVLRGSQLDVSQYVFQAVPLNDGTLGVEFICRHQEWQWMPNSLPGGGLVHAPSSSDAKSVDRGTWILSGSSGKLKVDSATLGVPSGQSGGLWIVQPDFTNPMFNTFEQMPGKAGLTFNVGDYLNPPLMNVRLLSGTTIQAYHKPLKTLLASPSTYRVTTPHHYPQYVLQGPCFYQDFARTYIVTREQVYWSPISKDSVFKHSFSLKADAFLSPDKIEIGDVPVTRPLTENSLTQKASRQERIYGPNVALSKEIARFGNSGTVMVPATDALIIAKAPDQTGSTPWTLPNHGGSLYLGYSSGEVWFRNLFHPHVSEFIKRLDHGGVDELLSINTQKLDKDGSGNQFASNYLPTANVIKPYPREHVDFGEGAYSDYNRELFFHAPMLMTDVYETAGLWDDAERCLRYILDPTAGSATSPTPGTSTDVFWQFLPFQGPTPARIQDLLTALSYTGADPKFLALKAETTTQIAAWEKDPFNPYLIGRLRIGAMQKYVAIRWLQHLILRADLLLRSDRPEPINEAVQLLVLAANFAGPSDGPMPSSGQRKPQSFHTLQPSLDRFSNALVQLENEFPISAALPTPTSPPGGGLLGMSEALYFCIPQNDVLVTLRDTIADRLFKVRHCMNIEGVVRDLPLYDPPIDPMLLVAARAQGLDLASVLSDLNAPLPHHYFSVCFEHASQAVEDVRRLGQDLKGIMEAGDAEDFNVRRARQDLQLLRDHMRQVKQRQVDEAKARIATLKESEKLLSSVRIPYFMKQLGLSETPTANTNVSGNVQLSPSELARTAAIGRARSQLADAAQYEMSAKMMSAIPTITSGTSGTMGSPVLELYLGGHMLTLGLEAFAQTKSQGAADASHQATLAQIRGEVERRAEQWAFDLSAAVQEHQQVEKQLLEALIGLDIAEFQLVSHDRETDFAQDRLEFLENKPTAVPHHEWLEREVGLLLGQYYQVAFDECKRAQQVYRFDTGDLLTTFVEFGYFDKAHYGLLAGERLGLSLRKMSRAYRDQDRYQYELSKPVSLALCDPMALMALKATGSCEFALTEALFDADFPGHFMRRLHDVSVTIPCITGPYTTINATLTLLNSRMRTTGVNSGDYSEGPDDPRFVYHQGIMRSIATSSANEDHGRISNPSEGRKGPIEGYGAISHWRLELPHDTNALDPETVMDVILRVDFKSQEGGQALRDAARKTSIQPPIKSAARLFSIRHEFAESWYRGIQPADPSSLEQIFEFDLDTAHFPYGVRSREPKLANVTVFLQINEIVAYQAGVALQAEVSLTPLVNGAPFGASQTQVVALQSIGSRLGGLPMALIPLAGKIPVRMQVKLKSVDVALIAPLFVHDVGTGAMLRHRLNARTVRGLDVLVGYDTAL